MRNRAGFAWRVAVRIGSAAAARHNAYLPCSQSQFAQLPAHPRSYAAAALQGQLTFAVDVGGMETAFRSSVTTDSWPSRGPKCDNGIAVGDSSAFMPAFSARARSMMMVGRIALLIDEDLADLLRRVTQFGQEPLDRHLQWHGCSREPDGHGREDTIVDQDRHGHADFVGDPPGRTADA